MQFYGNEKRISERSSFQVFTDECIPAPTGRFDISFEYATNNIESPGYILYLKNADGEEAFNLTYVCEHGKKHFMFAQDGKQIYYTAQYDDKNPEGKWMLVSLQMDIANNRAEISIGSQNAALEDIGLKKGQKFTPQPFFGMYDHILETASFSIRNLTISNGTKSWHFPLNENKGENVHDSQGNVIGHIKNPIWLINNSYHWKPIFRFYSATPSGLAFDVRKQKFHIYNQDSITSYSLYEQATEQFPYTPGSNRLPTRLGMNFVNETQGIIYAYELNGKEDTYIAEINPEERIWKNIAKGEIPLQMHHHCGLYDPQRRRLLFFGGYGNRQYYNHFITYNFTQSHWDTLVFSGDIIPPRFFAGIATTPDGKYAYIYGGKGNDAGDQNIGIQYYYDLYRVDFETLQIKKLWEHKAPKANRVPVRNMILSKDGKYIYLLAYPEYKPESQLQMYRISISDGGYEALGDSIPLTSEEIATNANLYFNPEQDEFYCTIQEFEKYGQNTTRIYSLANPPVSLADLVFYDEPADLPEETARWIYQAIAMLVTVIGGLSIFIFICRKKLMRRTLTPREEIPPHTTEVTAPPTTTSQVPALKEEEEPGFFLPETRITRNNNLSLFGTFYATDRNGRDITYMFSPKIRHLFLYLLINSITKDGVLSSDLNSLFWPDKPDDKIKNLKNVTMSHLRKTLQEMDGIELTHQKGYFKIQLTEACYCDYQQFFVLTGGMKQAPATDDKMKELYDIFSQGKFLHTIESSLFDYPKQATETFVIQLLSEQVGNLYKSGKDKSTIYACKMLFSIDSLSDTAMTYIVCTYRKQDKLDKAMQFYMAFCKEYRKIMGEDYPIAFEEVDINHIRV